MRPLHFAATALSLSILAACSSDDDVIPAGPPVDGGALQPSEVDFVALSWNVGNPAESTDVYSRRIRSLPFEMHLSQQIADLSPEIVGLQEMLAPERCARIDETDPDRTCFGVSDDEPPVRRLLGADYSIVCDQNRQSSCIGVHVDFGTIRGVERGALDLTGAETPPLPHAPCRSADCRQESGTAECLEFTNVSTVLVDTHDFGTIRVVNVHLHPWGSPCRGDMLEDAFALVDEHPTVMMGDWNFEPGQRNRREDAIWEEHVGGNARFTDHHPRDARGVAIPTKDGRPIDRLVTDFATGQCEVRTDPPLHAGFDFEARGMADEASRQPDHAAVVCPLGVERQLGD